MHDTNSIAAAATLEPVGGSVRARMPAAWLLAGMFAFVPHLVAVLLASAQRPGFDHRAQYLSELGERGSATSLLVNFGGILPTGLLLAWFGIGLLRSYRPQRLLAIAGALVAVHGICRMIAAFSPCDTGCRPLAPSMSQSIHNGAATLGLVVLTFALFMAAAWLLSRRRGVAVVLATYALAIVAVAAEVLLAVAHDGNTGLYQRVALGALQLGCVVLAVHLAARPADATLAPAGTP